LYSSPARRLATFQNSWKATRVAATPRDVFGTFFFMILDASCEISFEANAGIPMILMLRPRSGYAQWVMREEYAMEPHSTVIEYTDDFGNLCQRVVMGPGKFSIRCSCRAQTADVIDVDPSAGFVLAQDIPQPALQFLLPSRYCQSDMLRELASSIAGNLPGGYPQVEAIRRWLHENLKYQYGTSNASTSAVDTAQSKTGVCRDYAHLGMALCRSLNIPARMVVGYLYLLDPMDLHAWFEAFVGGRWYVFDGTQKEPRGNRIAIAFGRDAADVALVTQFGALNMTSMKVQVNEARGR
jgi:transglutaminase-like putative cysteine protease